MEGGREGGKEQPRGWQQKIGVAFYSPFPTRCYFYSVEERR